MIDLPGRVDSRKNEINPPQQPKGDCQVPKSSRSFILAAAALSLISTSAYASHSWNGYHWARQSNPFTLKVYDNVSAVWEPYVAEARQDWNQSNVLDLNVLWGSPLTSTKKCGSATGVIEICNDLYGQRGWLGIAGIAVSGSHITRGYTKLNDSYFNTPQYNSPAWRRLVTCQELAHDFGLAHQDENFNNANLGSCMDYTSDPDGGAGGASSNDPSNEHPNAHDFSMISSIYNHNDSFSTVGLRFEESNDEALARATVPEAAKTEAEQWGTAVKVDADGRPNVFIKVTGMNAQGEPELEITHVFWAPDAHRHQPDDHDEEQ
jgi:hypothetical protein